MILVDSNVLIALCDERDELHLRAARDLDAMGDERLYIPEPVLVEVMFAMQPEYLRRKLVRIIDLWQIEPWAEGDLRRLWSRALAWSLEYGEHRPDWADAYTAMLSDRHRGVKVWTYDEEFRTIWRRSDGSAIPLAIP